MAELNSYDVELSFRANKLPSVTLGLVKEAAYFLGIYSITSDPGLPLEFLNFTETVNDESPTFTVSSKVARVVGSQQEYLVRVFNLHTGDDPTIEANRKELCEAKFSLGALVDKGYNFLSLPLTEGKSTTSSGSNCGVLEIRTEEMIHHRGSIKCAVSYKSLLKSAFQFQPHHFIAFFRVNEGGSKTMVYRLPVKKGWEAAWPDVVMEIQKLCNTDNERGLFLASYTASSNGSTNSSASGGTLIGQCNTTLNEILEASKNSKCFVLLCPTNKLQHVGELKIVVEDEVIPAPPTYLDYLKVLDFSLLYGIDFTGSNGDPQVPDSLHYIESVGDSGSCCVLNPYEKSLSISARILEKFDADKIYQMFGFGAKTIDPASGKKSDRVDHCIEITNNAEGVEGILASYRGMIKNLSFSGPTCFAPIIRKATQFAIENAGDVTKVDRKNLKYTILVMITDGNIVDIDDTKAAIVEASEAPLSIIIIGVGSDRDYADRPTEDSFAVMRVLDSDGELLKVQGKNGYSKQAKRDIVQFVAFEETMSKGEDYFAQQLQAELPEQVVSYFDQIHVLPDLS